VGHTAFHACFMMILSVISYFVPPIFSPFLSSERQQISSSTSVGTDSSHEVVAARTEEHTSMSEDARRHRSAKRPAHSRIRTSSSVGSKGSGEGRESVFEGNVVV